jgi:hypothetical protein
MRWHLSVGKKAEASHDAAGNGRGYRAEQAHAVLATLLRVMVDHDFSQLEQ